MLTEQHLDSMDLEKERGITIKMHPVVMNYPAKDGKIYKLHLTDTPGHVDFAYEVSRSLAAVEGALLLIDAAQGVEAQTVANAHLAFAQGLKVIPVINKIDLPSANLDLCIKQLEDILTIPGEEAILASGKSGIGIEDILEAVVTRIPPPRWTDYPTLRRLVFGFEIRFLPRRDFLCPRVLRHDQGRRNDVADEHGPALRGEGGRRFPARHGKDQ